MPASVVSICNQALGRIGHSEPIASIDEQSEGASTCNTYFDQVLDEVLVAFVWPFAFRRLTMALVEEDPNDDWAYAYRRPSDALTLWKVTKDTSRHSMPLAFEVGGDDTGGLIFADEETAGVQYISRVSNPALWPPLFINSLSWRLAMEIAPVLSESMSDAARLRQGYEMAISAAKSHAANEGVPDAELEATFIRDRGYSVGGSGEQWSAYPTGTEIS